MRDGRGARRAPVRSRERSSGQPPQTVDDAVFAKRVEVGRVSVSAGTAPLTGASLPSTVTRLICRSLGESSASSDNSTRTSSARRLRR